MPQAESTENASSLEALARAHFAKGRQFTRSERLLLTQVTGGEMAICGPASDAKNSSGWSQDREIGADLIRWLCVDKRARERVDPLGVQIQGAKITGKLNLASVTVPFPIRLASCVVMEILDLSQAQLPRIDLNGTWTKSILADSAVVKGDVSLRNGFRADGEVRWPGGEIGGDFYLDGGVINKTDGYALFADRATVKRTVFLRYFRANGEVRWLGARVGGDFDCIGSTLNNPGGYALNADHLQVQGNLFLSDRFSASGSVNLAGAQIGGEADCVNGKFTNSNKTALSMAYAVVKGNVLLRDGFTAQGVVSLLGAHIEGRLDLRKAEFKAALLDLRNTSASLLADDREHWPARGGLKLGGFMYGRIDDGPRDADARLAWLALQPEDAFETQPYLQSAKVLREAGDEDGGVTVLQEMERRRRERADQGRPDRQAISWLFKELAGYGYDPGRSVWAILALSGAGWILYRRSYLMGGVVPVENGADGGPGAGDQAPRGHDAFAPLAYSVENSLPLVKLGQADKWQLNPDPVTSPPRNAKWIASARREKRWPRRLVWLERLLMKAGLLAPLSLDQQPSRWVRSCTSPRFLRWFLWVQILLGWLLATLFVAGVTGIIRKD